MGTECPFCWGTNIRPVGLNPADDWPTARPALVECGDCEKWFWAGTGAEVQHLCQVCGTLRMQPARCDPDVRRAAQARPRGLPAWRRTELNELCSRCRSRDFEQPAEGLPMHF